MSFDSLWIIIITFVMKPILYQIYSPFLSKYPKSATVYRRNVYENQRHIIQWIKSKLLVHTSRSKYLWSAETIVLFYFFNQLLDLLDQMRLTVNENWTFTRRYSIQSNLWPLGRLEVFVFSLDQTGVRCHRGLKTVSVSRSAGVVRPGVARSATRCFLRPSAGRGKSKTFGPLWTRIEWSRFIIVPPRDNCFRRVHNISYALKVIMLPARCCAARNAYTIRRNPTATLYYNVASLTLRFHYTRFPLATRRRVC